MRMRLLVAVGSAVVAASGCYNEGSIRRVSFGVEIQGASDGPLDTVTPSGWMVHLDRALISLGPVYLSNVRPNAGGAEDMGRIVGEVLGIFTVDALDPTPRSLAVGGLGTTEQALAGEVRLVEAQEGPLADTFGPRSTIAHVVGRAERNGELVPFDGTFIVPVSANTPAFKLFRDHQIQSIPTDLVLGQDGTLTITVDASRWFDSVVFDRLTPDGESVRDFRDASELGQLRSGLASRTTFSFSFAPAE